MQVRDSGKSFDFKDLPIGYKHIFILKFNDKTTYNCDAKYVSERMLASPKIC